jgi:Phosphotransferase enzyme family
MELLAQGRDCDVYDLGDGTVLRRSRKEYDQTPEARVLEYADQHGYPVPAVVEVRDDGRDLVMAKIEGPTLGDLVLKRPWKVGYVGRMLADLHNRLHEIPAPDWVPSLPEGDRLVHFDLHPLNVILSPTGPVVIDWTNALGGRPGHDSARAWVLMACAGVGETGGITGMVERPLRRRLVDTFLDDVGREEAAACLAYCVEVTLLDGNIAEGEKAAMRDLVRRAGRAEDGGDGRPGGPARPS